MKTYLDCWISVAKSLFSQALAGEPTLVEKEQADKGALSGSSFVASFEGDVTGTLTVALDPLILNVPLLGDGVDQSTAWQELLREVAEAAAGELFAISRKKCTITSFGAIAPEGSATCAFELTTAERCWRIAVRDQLSLSPGEQRDERAATQDAARTQVSSLSPGVELLLDVELEAALRFGCCEMPLGEILDLGPGDVVELDRHVTDPVDLIVGNKIVAKGEVVLINGNFGLRVTEVAAPQKRLESIRCLF
jgi:flagellar motor switch protein FliN